MKFFNIKGILWLILSAVSNYPLQAQENKSVFNVNLKSESAMQITVCSPEIFRIRVSANKDFPQLLLERYGILKSDWETVAATSKTEKGNQIIQTAQYKVVVNMASGDILVKDSGGKTVIERITCVTSSSGLTSELGQSLNKYFGKAQSQGGIIGDTNHTGGKQVLEEIGDMGKSSILDISLKDRERFYGGGATSRKNIQHRGEALRMWATYQKTEITMPFVASSNGWGIFNNTTSKNYFDIGRYQKDKLLVYNTDGSMDFYLMLGKSIPEAINLYTTVTGKPYLLPKWAYGLAFGGNTMENQMNMMDDALKFRDEKIPCDIFWIEPQWMEKNYDFSTSKTWNQDKFPGEPFWEVKTRTQKREHPLLFISKLHQLGFKLALWLCIDHDLSVVEEDQLAKENGKPQSGQEHWFPHLTRFIDQGVDGFKLDPGRTLDEHPDRKYYNGLTDKEMHNMNQVLLPKQMYHTFRGHKGIRSFHHYCGGYAGTQHWGASTSGDNGGGKEALYDQLNLGLSGFVNTTADVMEADKYGVPETKGAIHMGFFLPWVQVNSWYALHHPWYLPPLEKETFRYYAQLRNRLTPYIYSAAIEGSQTGMPILRAMPLECPDDRQADNLIYQYMFGANFLVGVFSDSVYLPKGNWINYWDDKPYTGGRTVKCSIPPNRGGLLFVKGGAIIPMQKLMNHIGEQPIDTLYVQVYPDGKSSYTLYEDDGTSFDYEKGIHASTRFTSEAKEGKTTLEISPVEGSYKGMFSSRAYVLNVRLTEKPKQVTINGKNAEQWIYGPDNRLQVTVAQNNLKDKITVVVN